MLLKNTSRMASWLFNFLLNFALFFGVQSSNDVILGGIFSEHFPRMSQSGNTRDKQDNNPCEEHNRRATADRLAMEFAVSEINRSGDILNGIRLGTNMKDTCSDLDYAVNNTLDYEFIKTRFVNSSYQCAPQETGNKCCLNRTEYTPLVAIIAGAYSHIVKAIVNLVGLFKVPVIGYSSTSPSLNKIDYFLRTVAPDTDVAQVMVDLILRLHWNIVLVLYVDNEFGHYAADCFRTAIRRSKTKICIAYDGKFSKASTQGEIKGVVADIKKAKSRVITFFGTIEDFLYFQEHSNAFGADSYVWISSELWLRSDLIGISESIKHMLTIIPEQGYRQDLFNDYLQKRADVNKTCSRVHRNNMKCERGLMYNRSAEGNCSFERSKYIPHVLDAVYAVAMGMHNMLGCQPGKSCRDKLKTIQHRSLLRFLNNLTFFNNLTKQNISFDSNGNPRVTRFTVVKLEIGNGTCNDTIIGNWTCRQKNATASCTGRLSDSIIKVVDPTSFNSSCGPTCAPGRYKSVKEDHPDCCWTCEKCTGNKFTNTSGQFGCSECDDNHWPNSNHTSCAEIEHYYLDIRSAPGVLILAWNCLGVAVILLVGGVFLKYSTSHIVKASSRQLSLLLLLGISLDFAILMALLREPNASQCTAIFVLGHAANCLVAGTLFLKTNRIHRIFRKSAMTEHPRCLGNGCQLSIIMILVLIEVTLAATVLVFQPEDGQVKVTYIMQGDNKKAFLLCKFFGKTFQNDLFHVLIWSYDCGMIFICTYQAYLVRKVPENYNEARYITFTMVTISMNIIVFVITTSGMEGKNLVLVYCIFQSLKASVALGCMFLPKVYVILFQPERNVPQNPAPSKLGTFVEDNSVVRVKPHDSISSGSSIQASVSSENSTGGTGTAPTSTRRRSYRKVGVKMEEGPEEGPEDKFESAGDFDDLPAREQDVSTDTTEGLKRSANIVLVNSLATSNSTA